MKTNKIQIELWNSLFGFFIVTTEQIFSLYGLIKFRSFVSDKSKETKISSLNYIDFVTQRAL